MQIKSGEIVQLLLPLLIELAGFVTVFFVLAAERTARVWRSGKDWPKINELDISRSVFLLAASFVSILVLLGGASLGIITVLFGDVVANSVTISDVHSTISKGIEEAPLMLELFVLAIGGGALIGAMGIFALHEVWIVDILLSMQSREKQGRTQFQRIVNMGKIGDLLPLIVISVITLIFSVSSLLWLYFANGINGNSNIFLKGTIIYTLGMIIAVLLVMWIYRTSHYSDLFDARIRGRKKRAHAGVLVIVNEDGEILFNRQVREPWQGRFVLPGGYINEEKGDRSLRHTALRRFGELLGIKGGYEEIVEQLESLLGGRISAHKLAALNLNSDKLKVVFAVNGYAPIDISAYILEYNGLFCAYRDVLIDVLEKSNTEWAWFSSRNLGDDVVEYYQEMVHYINGDTTNLEAWLMEEEFRAWSDWRKCRNHSTQNES